MPTINNDLLRTPTLVSNITFADYTAHPTLANNFFFNKLVNVPSGFNAIELLIQTNSSANLQNASVIPQYEITNGVFVNLLAATVNLPSAAFPGLAVPSVSRLTLGMAAVGMLNINTIVFSPDGSTSIPMYGLLQNSQAYPLPITHPVFIKFAAVTLGAPISLSMTLSLTFFSV